MKKQKIAVIGLKGLPAFGGAATVGENIIEELKDKYDFTIYATSSHTDKKGYYNGYTQIVFKKFPIKKLNVFYYYIASALHAFFFGKYDLINLHHIDGAFIMFLLRLRYKVVSVSHGRPHSHKKWGKMFRPYFVINERFFLSLSNIVISVSKDLAEIYVKMTQTKVKYIPNGISLIEPTNSISSLYNKNYILFAAGRIIESKGCHVLLEALQHINYKGKILVIGDLDQVPKYKKTVLTLAENLDVEFLPIIKNKPLLMEYIKKASLFVFPSTYEAMSMMLLEVISVKTPVIASNIVANTNILNSAEILFFETNNVSDLASKVEWALQNPEQMELKTNKAYKKLINEYQWKDIALQYHDVFQSMITQ
jgi:glycosyltransferase involved in cell wall biosynthesis